MSEFENGNKIKDYLTGISLTCLIYLISTMLPVLGFFSSLLIPLPTLIYRLKLGRQNGLIIPLISFGLITVLNGGITADLGYFAGFIILGFSIGECIERDSSVEKTIFLSSLAVFGSGLICLLLYSSAANKGVSDLVSGYLEVNLELTLELYKSIGIPEDQIKVLSDYLDVIQKAIIRILPGLTISALIIVAWINLLMARPILKSKGLVLPRIGSLNKWKAPDHLVWGVIGFGILIILARQTASQFMAAICVNGLMILATIYFFQGIAIVSYYLEKKNVPPLFKFILYSVILLQHLVLLFVICIGFFDIWLNFRKLEPIENN